MQNWESDFGGTEHSHRLQSVRSQDLNELMKRYGYWSFSAPPIRIPFVDSAVMGTIQVKLIQAISTHLSPHKKEFPGRVKNEFRFLTNKFSGVLKNSKPWPMLAPFFGVP